MGTNIAQSVSGLGPAERTAARDQKVKRDERERSRRARQVDDDRVTIQTETAQAVRDLKGNDQEEAHEDRQEHALPSDRQQRHIDIEG